MLSLQEYLKLGFNFDFNLDSFLVTPGRVVSYYMDLFC